MLLYVLVGAISNDLKYVVIGGIDLQILDYQTTEKINGIHFDNCVQLVKFTDDSKQLYVLTFTKYKFELNNILYQMQYYQYLLFSADGNIIMLNIQKEKTIISCIRFRLQQEFEYNSKLMIDQQNYEMVMVETEQPFVKCYSDKNKLLSFKMHSNSLLYGILIYKLKVYKYNKHNYLQLVCFNNKQHKQGISQLKFIQLMANQKILSQYLNEKWLQTNLDYMQACPLFCKGDIGGKIIVFKMEFD